MIVTDSDLEPAPEDPDDAVIVFRAVRAGDLSAACSAVEARGIPAVTDWRPTAVPRGFRYDGLFAEGEGELRVPRRCQEEARRALATHEDEAHARIRAHVKAVPRDLARIGLLAAVAVFVPLSLVGGVSDWVLGGLATAIVILGCTEVAARTRERKRGPVSNSPPPQPPGPRQRWFDTRSERKPRR